MPKVLSEIEGLPDALTSRDQWVCWRREERDGKVTKVPVGPATGDYASTTDPGTWTDVETATTAVASADADGVGFVFAADDPLVGIDLDDCRDPDSGTIDEWARDIITRLDSYAEVSPSGTGVHVIAEGGLPDGRSRRGDVEMYETSRFFTVTGEHLDATPLAVERRVDAIRGVHADYVREQSDGVDDEDEPLERTASGVDLEDDKLLERARSAENGDRFEALFQGRTSGYDSHSEADMALCLHLAFWTGGDPSRMDGLFRRSGLMREKWDEVHYADGATYGERTIERALERVDEVYVPDADSNPSKSEVATSTSPTETDNDGRDETSTRSMEDESVYLEERNRLLREKVRTQQATIDEQAARIGELEQELEAVRDGEAVCDGADQHQPEQRGPWDHLLTWFGISRTNRR